MEEKELLQKIDELLSGKIITKGIHNVNHTLGHGYTIGPKHIHYASEHFGGMLGQEAIDGFEKNGGKCAHPHCSARYEEHKSDKVLFVQLTQNLTKKEATDLIKPVGALLEENKIDGISFVDTTEKFRIS